MPDDDPAAAGSHRAADLFEQALFAHALAADFGDGIVYPVGVTGDDGLYMQRLPHKGGNPSDPPSVAQVFERVHIEKLPGIRPFDPHPLHQLLIRYAFGELSDRPQRKDPAAEGDVLGVEHRDTQVRDLRSDGGDSISHAAQRGRDRDGDHVFEALFLYGEKLVDDLLR